MSRLPETAEPPVEDKYQVHVTQELSPDRQRVLKHGDTFGVFNRSGDIFAQEPSEGLYHEGTRFLSRMELTLHRYRPVLLNSIVDEKNGVLVIDGSNPELSNGTGTILAQGMVHLFRAKLLWQECCHEHVRLTSYSAGPIELELEISFDSDYADIFEVRGMSRERRGQRLAQEPAGDGFTMAYMGLDGVKRRTIIRCDPAPDTIGQQRMLFHVHLEPHQTFSLCLSVACAIGAHEPEVLCYEDAFKASAGAFTRFRNRTGRLTTNHELFNDWLNRSYSDLQMLLTRTSEGLFPYAGIPWYSTAFGRDGLLTALMCLAIDPSIARGVLSLLAHYQARHLKPEQDAEPGKILHETRRGEMAALGEVPFGLYYGSIDSTPLFVMLAGHYYRRTGDIDLVRRLWPNIERALQWIDHYGDSDGDGFIEYQAHAKKGLVQQGWKDSFDSVFHADGGPAEHPIALCEVQGYVYAARRGAAAIARALGYPDRAEGLEQQAETLRVQFEERFWIDDLKMYALALDGAKRPCRVRTSNAGQCLMSGIVSPERAPIMANALMEEGMSSGWGIRTLHRDEACYNPMSYHNGSIWPHDNALIAWGMARYGLVHHVERLLCGLFDASLFVDLHRLPELFCGFTRRDGQGPTLYPVACSPQAWATAAPFMLLQACLGLEVDALERKVSFLHPVLPTLINELTLRNLRVGEAILDLKVIRYPLSVGINIERREGDVTIIAVK